MISRPLLTALLLITAAAGLSAQAPVFSIGEPTGDEQLYLELINRARANPAEEGVRLASPADAPVQEGYRYFSVNTALMKQEFAALAAKPPLSMNGALVQAARLHSQDMFNAAFQGHTGSDGSTPQQRLQRSGYPGNLAGENVYAFSLSPAYGHASFEADWGAGPGGMQTGRPHRVAIHGNIRDVGIGLMNGRKSAGGSDYGPEVVTQLFGNPSEKLPRITGVAYYDLNGNRFYDPGEGIGGVSVEIPGANWRGVTAGSGGYTVPVPREDVPREVNFKGLGFDTMVSTVITAAQSVKVDLTPVYTPPAVTGPPQPAAGAENVYTFSPVPGAVSYEWRWGRREAAVTDGAEDLSRVSAAVSPGLNPLTSAVKSAGAASYHLAHPEPAAQKITCRSSYLPGAAPVLEYHSLLGWATPAQTARVEISTNDGLSWVTVDAQSGTGGAGQSAFAARRVSLEAAGGKEFLLRFVYDVPATAEHIPGDGPGRGWYIDQISLRDVSDLGNSSVQSTGTDLSFRFAPAVSAAPLLLSVRPVISGRPFPWGAPMEVMPAVRVSSPAVPAFVRWARIQEQQAGLAPGSLSAADGDFNRDGVSDLMAYALGLSPAASAPQALPQPALAGNELVLDYPADSSKADVILISEASEDLQHWFTPGAPGAPEGYREEVLSTEGSVQTRRASVPCGARPVFLRLKAARR